VCAIAYYLESEGIMTTGISLVRENTASMQPPRMLWVSFPLGHPLGKPGDAEFQHQVIAHALELLERPAGPVLEDFPLDVPQINVAQAAACPISFAAPAVDGSTWENRLANELLLLRPWYDLGRRRRQRTTVGASDSSVETILKRLAQWLDHPDGPLPDLKWFKYAIEDAKAYYSESLTAQPGDYPAGYVQKEFWNETVLGEGLRRYYEHFSTTPDMETFARLVASREAIGGSTGGDDMVQQALQKGKIMEGDKDDG
jgi:D-proline reductase (dithiol) PrdB